MTLGEWMDEEAAKEKEIGRAEGRLEGISCPLLKILRTKGEVSAELGSSMIISAVLRKVTRKYS